MYVWVWGGGWGVDGGWMPLPTRPQRYCDPASLVSFYLIFDGFEHKDFFLKVTESFSQLTSSTISYFPVLPPPPGTLHTELNAHYIALTLDRNEVMAQEYPRCITWIFTL